MIQINKKKVLEKWSPILEKMDIKDPVRKEWMSEYAEYHQIHENVAYANLANITGMGAVLSPVPSSIPGQTASGGGPVTGVAGDAYGNGGAVGSGDYGQQLFPIAMKIAAQTIGLDLVAVKPSPGPVIDLMYIDYRYDDGIASSNYNPVLFKVNGTNPVEQAALVTKLKGFLTTYGIKQTSGGLSSRLFVTLDENTSISPYRPAGVITSPTTIPATNAVVAGVLEFVGFSRIDGLPMFMSYRATNAVPAGNFSWNQNNNSFGELETVVQAFALAGTSGVTSVGGLPTGAAIVLVSTMEDQVPQFSNGAGNPMNRATDDQTYPGIVAPNVTTKRVQVGTIEVSSALKRTEIEDIKAQTGIDIVQKLEGVLVNELSQTISKQIVSAVFNMGESNRTSAPSSITTNISDGTIFDFDVDVYLTGNAPTGESSQAIQRKLVTRIKNASGFINTEGRVGPATYIVTNHTMAAALTEGANYTLNPVDYNVNGNNQLYPMGKVAGMTVYVDPYMKYDDKRILLGRKNNPDQPGIIFVPYLMAQSVQLISEATWAPRLLLRSRYAVTEVGFYPWKQYMAIHVYDSKNILN